MRGRSINQKHKNKHHLQLLIEIESRSTGWMDSAPKEIMRLRIRRIPSAAGRGALVGGIKRLERRVRMAPPPFSL